MVNTANKGLRYKRRGAWLKIFPKGAGDGVPQSPIAAGESRGAKPRSDAANKTDNPKVVCTLGDDLLDRKMSLPTTLLNSVSVAVDEGGCSLLWAVSEQ